MTSKIKTEIEVFTDHIKRIYEKVCLGAELRKIKVSTFIEDKKGEFRESTSREFSKIEDLIKYLNELKPGRYMTDISIEFTCILPSDKPINYEEICKFLSELSREGEEKYGLYTYYDSSYPKTGFRKIIAKVNTFPEERVEILWFLEKPMINVRASYMSLGIGKHRDVKISGTVNIYGKGEEI